MKFCFNCGFEHKHTNANFCASCGTDQRVTPKPCSDEEIDWSMFDGYGDYVPPLWTKNIQCECKTEPHESHATHATYCPKQQKRAHVMWLLIRDGIIDGSHPAVMYMCRDWTRVVQ
jgi:hypothetical protein